MNPQEEDKMVGDARRPPRVIQKFREIRCRKCGGKLRVSPFDDPNFVDTLCTDCSNDKAEEDRFKL